MENWNSVILLVAVIGVALASGPAETADIVIVNLDGPGEGLNDPSTPTVEMGCPAGLNLGECRMRAVAAAANRWAAILKSGTEIRLGVRFDPLQCDAMTTDLATGDATVLHANFTGAPYTDTWYPGALADALFGSDLWPSGTDLEVTINSNLDSDPTCAPNWWYGTDGAFPGNFASGPDPYATHLLPVALHYIAKGLGFYNHGNKSTGEPYFGISDIYDRFIYDTTAGLHWYEMTNAQRVASAINTGEVVLDGTRTRIAADDFLTGSQVDLVVTSGAAAGTYVGEGGLFGAPWTRTDGVTAQMELVFDGAGSSNTDGCEPLIGFTPGRIAVADRGTCQFGLKALHAEQAGAVGVVIANNTVGTTTMAAGEYGRQVSIPVIVISQADGNLIRVTLPAGAIYDVIDTRGVHADGFPKLYAPAPLDTGLSITHFDTSAGPNALMEPTVALELYRDLDITVGLLRDEGWEVVTGPEYVRRGIAEIAGGSQFASYYSSAAGDVVGYRFTVSNPIRVDRIGVWNVDTTPEAYGLSSPHQVGIWNASQALVAWTTVDRVSGTTIGDWIYAPITPVTLNPGQVYTAGALYTPTDQDSYISSATTVVSDPRVTWIESAYPTAAELGFVYPAGSSVSFGRFGPNFTFLDPDLLFADRFESGDTSAWTITTP